MNEMELLNWARGPGLQIAGALFIVGLLVRLGEILLLGRKADLSVARRRNTLTGSATLSGLRTVLTRSWPDAGTLRRTALVYIAGYVFHLGFLLTLLFFAPHILLIKGLIGVEWPGLPVSLIDVLAVLSIAALVALLINRLVDPVRRHLSGFGDWYSLLVTLLPLVTGYLALNRMLLPYSEMLAWHILSVELLLVSIPFTKLTHMVSFAVARWYNGAIAGRKGVNV
jgi:nitrate reductase gamma subunit